MVYGLERGATSNFKYIIDKVFNQSMCFKIEQTAMTYHFSNIIALFFGKLIKM